MNSIPAQAQLTQARLAQIQLAQLAGRNNILGNSALGSTNILGNPDLLGRNPLVDPLVGQLATPFTDPLSSINPRIERLLNTNPFAEDGRYLHTLRLKSLWPLACVVGVG